MRTWPMVVDISLAGHSHVVQESVVAESEEGRMAKSLRMLALHYVFLIGI